MKHIAIPFSLFTLITFLIAFECKGEDSNLNTEHQNSLFKKGKIVTVIGIVLGATGGIILATNTKQGPPSARDLNYDNKRTIGSAMIIVAIPITTAGIITLFKGKDKRKGKTPKEITTEKE